MCAATTIDDIPNFILHDIFLIAAEGSHLKWLQDAQQNWKSSGSSRGRVSIRSCSCAIKGPCRIFARVSHRWMDLIRSSWRMRYSSVVYSTPTMYPRDRVSQ